MNDSPKRMQSDISKYGRKSLWFLVQLTLRMKELLAAYGLAEKDDGRVGELVFAICSQLDCAVCGPYGDQVKSVLGFWEVERPDPKFDVLLVPRFSSSLHDWVYPLVEILREDPEYADKTSGDDFTEAEIEGLYQKITGGR